VHQTINVVAFDADDTLWVTQPLFQEAISQITQMLSPYVTEEQFSKTLSEVERANVPVMGYGTKGFILYMVEAAIQASNGRISSFEIQQVLNVGKAMLKHPVQPLDGVEEVLKELHGNYRLMLITKGDLVEQERKISLSGLSDYFQDIVIVSEKDESSYENVLAKHRVDKDEFLMVGNSIKSDILPVMNIGSNAVHIPFHTTWEMEMVEPSCLECVEYLELKHANDLLPILLP